MQKNDEHFVIFFMIFVLYTSKQTNKKQVELIQMESESFAQITFFKLAPQRQCVAAVFIN